MGLIDTNTGLHFGEGLQWMTSIGGPGLVISSTVVLEWGGDILTWDVQELVWGGNPTYPYSYLAGITQAYALIGFCVLPSGYGGPIVRLRRASDDAELDFYPMTNGWLDANEVSSWSGASDVYVVALYDQTGNGHDAVQSTSTDQALLAPNARSMILDGGDDTYLLNSSVDFGRAVSGITLSAVARSDNADDNRVLLQTNTSLSTTRCRIYRTITAGNATLTSRMLDGDSAIILNSAANIGTTWKRWLGNRDYAGATEALVIDDVAVESAAGTPGITSNTASPSNLALGSSSASSYWAGGIVCGIAFAISIDADTQTSLIAALTNIMEDSFDGAAFALWGDSLSTDYGATIPADGWPNLVPNSYTPRLQCFDGGVGGETSTQILARVEASTQYRTTRLNTFWMGRNDLINASTQAQIDAAVITIKQNVAAAVATAANYIVISELPYADGFPEDSAAKRLAIAELNTYFSGLYADRYLDVASLLTSPDTRLPDGLHPNDLGHSIIADAVEAKAAEFISA